MAKIVGLLWYYGSGMGPVPVADAFRASARCCVGFGRGGIRGGFVIAREAGSRAVMRASVSSFLGGGSGLSFGRVVG